MSVEEIAGGCSLEAVQDMVRQLVGPHGILVGHSVQHDIDWLELRKGIHYGSFVDTAEVFALVIPGKTTPTRLSLQQVALGLLEEEIQREGHCSVEDARISIRLLLKKGGPTDIDQSRATL